MAKKNKQKKPGKAHVFEPGTQKTVLPKEPIDDDEDEEDGTDEEADVTEEEEAMQERVSRVVPNAVASGIEAATRPARHPAHDTELSPSDILLASLAMVASGVMTEDAVAEQIRQAFESMKPRQRVAQGSALVAFLNKIRHTALQLAAVVDKESKRE